MEDSDSDEEPFCAVLFLARKSRQRRLSREAHVGS